MRDYGKVAPTFWSGETGRKFRGNRDAQLVALYLITCPASNMLGLYYLPLPTLYHEIGISPQGASKALRRVSEVGFGHYDTPSEYVWIPKMAEFQLGGSLKPGDNRIKGIEKELSNHCKCPFFNAFLDKYGEAYNLSMERVPGSPFEAPSKPLRSQEIEIEQEIEQERERGESSRCSDLPRALFEHWNDLNVLTRHRALTSKMCGAIRARHKGGYTEADLHRAISRYAELKQEGVAPGHNNWGLYELMSRDEGDWIDRMLDPNYRGIPDRSKPAPDPVGQVGRNDYVMDPEEQKKMVEEHIKRIAQGKRMTK